jgi:hypothetical protein
MCPQYKIIKKKYKYIISMQDSGSSMLPAPPKTASYIVVNKNVT